MPTVTIRKSNDKVNARSQGLDNKASTKSRGLDERVNVNQLGIDDNKYGKLLAQTLPVAIHTEKDNERMLGQIEKLMAKGEANLTREEEALLELLTQIVAAYESRAYPSDRVRPAELVEFLLEQRGLSASALWPVLGSKGRVSEILSGKRAVSKEQAKRLGEFFHISPAAFI